MNDVEIILMLLGGVIGYCLCFVVEIAKITRFRQPPPPERPREKDPADWWKEEA